MPRSVRAVRTASTNVPTSPPCLHLREQREAVERLKRELSRFDPRSRSRYVARFLDEFSQAEAICTSADVLDEAARADVIYIADYHALPAAQAFAVRFLNLLRARTGGTRETVLCLETFYERDQRRLDAYLNGEIAEDELLRRTRYAAEWGYEWAGYGSLLRAARQHGLQVFGIDYPLRRSPRLIGRRDRAAAERIAHLLAARPGVQVVVFFGESHLAADHLPGKTREAVERLSGGAQFSEVVIAQNVDELYWRHAETSSARPAAVRVAAGKYCVFTATPLEKYQSYARVVEQWQDHCKVAASRGNEAEVDEAVIAAECLRLLDALLEALQLKPPRTRLRRARRLADSPPEIYCARSFSGFAALLKRAGASAREIKTLRSRAQSIGCAYASRINALFVSSFDLVGVSEELARYVAAALRGQLWSASDGITPRHYNAADSRAADNNERRCGPRARAATAATMLDEALIFFASKLLVPQRSAPPALRSAVTRNAARLQSLPAAQRREAAARYRGRVRGEALYRALLAGLIAPTEIHQLLTANLAQPGDAENLWNEWSERWADRRK